jgi:hypothetical protein
MVKEFYHTFPDLTWIISLTIKDKVVRLLVKEFVHTFSWTISLTIKDSNHIKSLMLFRKKCEQIP